MLENIDTQDQVYSVSDLTAYIRALLESNENLMGIWVAGEISNLSRPVSGHIYFTLKDDGAALRCVIWREHAQRLSSALRDGLAVEAHGAVSVYEQGGQYQLYVDGLRAAGEGVLFQEFLRLKEKLDAEGLFDEARKRPIPQRPQTIGIVTSATGAALQDMLNTLRARFPLVQVVIAPCAVQGEHAPQQIVDALSALNRYVQPDVIIIGRGGGSLEDLWAFNDERVVRAVAGSSAPIISGVGHETDFTLTDFAADLRAPTPTGAAVLAVPDRQDVDSQLISWQYLLEQLVMEGVKDRKSDLLEIAHRFEQHSPNWYVRQGMQRVDDIAQRLHTAMQTCMRSQTAQLEALVNRLAALDPGQILKRGYALVYDSQGRLQISVEQLKLNQMIRMLFQDGTAHAQINDIEKQTDRKDNH